MKREMDDLKRERHSTKNELNEAKREIEILKRYREIQSGYELRNHKRSQASDMDKFRKKKCVSYEGQKFVKFNHTIRTGFGRVKEYSK